MRKRDEFDYFDNLTKPNNSDQILNESVSFANTIQEASGCLEKHVSGALSESFPTSCKQDEGNLNDSSSLDPRERFVMNAT